MEAGTPQAPVSKSTSAGEHTRVRSDLWMEASSLWSASKDAGETDATTSEILDGAVVSTRLCRHSLSA